MNNKMNIGKSIAIGMTALLLAQPASAEGYQGE